MASGGMRRKPLGEGKVEDSQKLKEECTTEQFRHWVHCLELQLDQAAGWQHWSRVLEKVRSDKEPITEARVMTFVTEINDSHGGSEDLIDPSFKVADKSQELYVYLMPRLSAELGASYEDEADQNGFEVFRLVNAEKDPALENLEFHLEGEIQALGQKRCTDLSETFERMKLLDRKAKEYRKKIARQIEEDKLAQSLWQAMDEHTLDLAENNGTSKRWPELKKFVEGRHVRQMSRKVAVPAPNRTKGSLNNCDDDKEEETQVPKEVTEAMLNMMNEGATSESISQVLSLMKGKGKGKAQGGWHQAPGGNQGGFQGSCGHCGKWGHRQNQCRDFDKVMEQYRTEKGKSKGKGKDWKELWEERL